MKAKNLANLYFFLCLVGMLSLAGIRSSPIYGKLDFILLDGRPWWKPWRPMIEQVLRQGNRPIISDTMTSSVLRGVFAQNAVTFRFDRRFYQIDVEELLRINSPQRITLPVGALSLLLEEQSRSARKLDGPEKRKMTKSVQQLMAEVAKYEGQLKGREDENRPYRCVINLKGFTPSWVPVETRHWSQWLAYTSAMYVYNGVRGPALAEIFREHPPENCMVFY